MAFFKMIVLIVSLSATLALFSCSTSGSKKDPADKANKVITAKDDTVSVSKSASTFTESNRDSGKVVDAVAKPVDTLPKKTDVASSTTMKRTGIPVERPFVGVDINKYREALRYGGTMAKALSVAGQPTRKKSFSNQQIWFYEKKCVDGGFHKQCIRFVIVFVNGKCASVSCNDNLYYN